MIRSTGWQNGVYGCPTLLLTSKARMLRMRVLSPWLLIRVHFFAAAGAPSGLCFSSNLSLYGFFSKFQLAFPRPRISVPLVARSSVPFSDMIYTLLMRFFSFSITSSPFAMFTTTVGRLVNWYSFESSPSDLYPWNSSSARLHLTSCGLT